MVFRTSRFGGDMDEPFRSLEGKLVILPSLIPEEKNLKFTIENKNITSALSRHGPWKKSVNGLFSLLNIWNPQKFILPVSH